MMRYVHVFGETVYITPEGVHNDGVLVFDLDGFIVSSVSCVYFGRCELFNLEQFLRTNQNVNHIILNECTFGDEFSIGNVHTITNLEVDATPIDTSSIPFEVERLTLKNLPELKSIDFMRSNTSIQYLKLWDTGVKSLEPLRGNIRVTTLNVSWCPIESLEPLRSNRTLTSFFFDNTPIIDLSPLWGNTSIRSSALATNLQLGRVLTKAFNLNASNAKLRHITLRSLSKTHI
jgi:hypothetical protein